MGSGSLIGLMDNAEYCNVTKHHGQGGERHGYRKKDAWLLQRGNVHWEAFSMGFELHQFSLPDGEANTRG